MMTNDNKLSWRKNWLDCINKLTSPDLQRKSWLDMTQTNPHWSYIEFMSAYFDDLGIDDNYKYPLDKGWLTNQEFQTIKHWHEAVDKYNPPNKDGYDHAAILDDARWKAILAIGLTMKEKLASTLGEAERNILTKEIDHLNFL